MISYKISHHYNDDIIYDIIYDIMCSKIYHDDMKDLAVLSSKAVTT